MLRVRRVWHDDPHAICDVVQMKVGLTLKCVLTISIRKEAIPSDVRKAQAIATVQIIISQN